MNKLKVRNIVLGEEVPKICVPIVGRTGREIQEQTENILKCSADLVEWRLDWYEEIENESLVLEVLANLRKWLGEIPLLATFRTKQEGGEREFTKEQYYHLLKFILKSNMVDLVDVELFMGDKIMKDLVEIAHKNGIFIVGSNHDFAKTPEKQVMIQRLCQMQELGADILKIAVMPNSKKDVLTLLEMTAEMNETYAKRPLITMSMSELGAISRLAGECFGSVITFGSAQKASAPGQIPVNELKMILQVLHDTKIK